MKPSEKRALKEQKRALEAEKIRLSKDGTEQSAEAQRAEKSNIYAEAHGDEDARLDKPYRRKEGFFQSHARLITFIITSLVVLTVLSPIGIDMLVSMKRDKVVTDKADIEVETLYAIYDSQAAIKWSHFNKYNYTDYSYDTKTGEYRVREYPIKDSRLKLKVGGPSNASVPDYAQLIDYKSGTYVDIFKSDPRDLVKSIEQEEE